MSRLLLSLNSELSTELLSTASMIPLEFSDKKAALAGAFLNRFTNWLSDRSGEIDRSRVGPTVCSGTCCSVWRTC